MISFAGVEASNAATDESKSIEYSQDWSFIPWQVRNHLIL